MTLTSYGDDYIEIGLSNPSTTITGDITLSGTIKPNRADKKILFQASKYKIYDEFLTELFGHDGTNNYMNHNLDMKGKSISLASQLSAINYVYTPTVRATNTEYWDVATTGDTDLKIKSGATNFMFFNTSNCINVYDPIIMNSNALSGITNITASGDITGNKGLI